MTLTQQDISREIDDERKEYLAAGEVRHHPARDYAPYRSSALRHPLHPPVTVHDPEAVELSGPVFGVTDVTETDADLTLAHAGEPLGERITVTGRVLDRAGRPVRGQLVELWQANAAGRYAHLRDQHPAPLDPNFTGFGRCLTDDRGAYAFTTVKPGAYPWRNHDNAWRPAHIHFSLFGTAFTQRLVTQMYFPGGPDLAPAGHPDTLTVHGYVHDGAGTPVPDAIVEIWQPGPDGDRSGAPGSLRRDPVTGGYAGRDGVTFTGFGRIATDADGHWAARTLPPGGVPYLSVCVFARGLLHHLYTRIYLPGPATDADPLLAGLAPERRATL
ncbi:dioxygenase family protein, partial [Streptomyces stackebrandtii]|uniref:dioxygenase family protein n=1 Tax=Streptomyces stackebrandtii TaxID=3051177 RepID=UPI0037D9DEF5